MTLLLLISLALGPQSPSPFGVETLRPHWGPTILLHRQPGPLVSLRLSVPIPTGLPEGSVELLQELARPEAEATARRLGARLELRHETGRAVVSVTGPAAAFDAMVALLRAATDDPDLSVASLRQARARAEDRVLARLEQPAPRIRRLLELALVGESAPAGATANRLDPEAIRAVRGLLYDTGWMRVTLVGSTPTAVIRSAFANWPGGRAGGRPDLAPDSTAEVAQPPTHREWGGVAFPADVDAPVLAVAAELVAERVRSARLRSGVVEAWYDPVPALVLIGAAAPGDTALSTASDPGELAVREGSGPPTAVERYLHRLVVETEALARPTAVAEARARVRRRLMLEARTAAGRAEVLGRLAERTGDEPGAYLERLERVTGAEVRSLLARVLASPALVADAR